MFAVFDSIYTFNTFHIIPFTNFFLSTSVLFFETFNIFYEALIRGYDKPSIQEIVISKPQLSMA